MELRLETRSERPPDCGYCRESVGEGGAVCSGCGAVLHAECERELGGVCPSVGCARGRVAPAPAVAKAAPRSRARLLRWAVRLLLLLLLGGLLARWSDLQRQASLSLTERDLLARQLMDEGAALARAGQAGDPARLREAIATFEQVLELQPRGARDRRFALEQIGYAWRNLGEPAAAEAAFGQIIEEEPERMLGYLWRGYLRLDHGDAAGALQDFDASLRVRDPDYRHPPDVDIRTLGRARARIALGDDRGALEDLDRWLTVWPTAEDDACRDRGLVRLRLGDEAGALEDLVRALEVQGGSSAAAIREGYEHVLATRPDSREAALMRAALARVPAPH